jgi:hypothetical protein
VRHWRPSRAEIAFLIGVPLAWAALLLFHPTGEGEDFYPVVAGEVTAWVAVHVGTLLFVPLIAAAVYLLLRGVEGAAASVARAALVPFVLFYAAWEVMAGIGLGVMVDQVEALPAADRGAGVDLVEGFADSALLRTFELIGTGALILAFVAAAVALRSRAHAPGAVAVLLVLAALPIAWHVTPFGQLGLALFLAAVVLLLRARSSPGAPAAGARPTPA